MAALSVHRCGPGMMAWPPLRSISSVTRRRSSELQATPPARIRYFNCGFLSSARAAFAQSVAALGTVNARESITVTAKVSEIVQRVHFDSGDEVAAGAVLVTLSGNQQQASLRAA